MDFIKQCLGGHKKVFENGEVKAIRLPRLSEFKFDDLYDEAMKYPEVKQFLPDTGKDRRFSKQWLANVSVSMVID